MSNFSLEQMLNQWSAVLLVRGNVDGQGEEGVGTGPYGKVVGYSEDVNAVGEGSLKTMRSDKVAIKGWRSVACLPTFS